MKILHIGKEGNMERFSAPNAPLYAPDTITAQRANLLTAEEYIAAMPDAEHIIADAISPVVADLINGLPNLRSIHSEGVAYNRIDVDAAKARGVIVCHSVGMNATAVAEQAILLMLGMLRNVAQNDQKVRAGAQITTKENYMKQGNLYDLADCSVGLVGFGNIARATARLLQAFGVQNIYYYKRTPLTPAEEAACGAKYLPLDDLLANSDIVSLHAPVTPETTHMANASFFHKMKPSSYFVNTARGELVDDAALCEALRSGKLTMAGLDTLNNEPVQPDNYILQQKDIEDKFLFSPHIGGITASSFRRSYGMIWEDIMTVREGKVPERAV